MPAWEMLWNDPIEMSTSKLKLKFMNKQVPFHQMVSFPTKSVKPHLTFLNNQFQYLFKKIILHVSYVHRGHQVGPQGFAFHMGGKVITIFPS